MARAPSIPESLIPSILLRWVDGESAARILAWIERTNRKRVRPVQTTRASVERIIQRACEADPRLAVGAPIERLRLNLEEDLNQLEAVEAALDRLATDLSHPDCSLVEVPERLRALDALALRLGRRVRLAGGEGPDRPVPDLSTENERARNSPRLDHAFAFKTSPKESHTRHTLPASERPGSPP